MTQGELFERLCLPELHKQLFSEILDALVKERLIKATAGRYSPFEAAKNIVTGTMRLHPRGFGFVKQENPELEDVFIPKHLTLNAVDGDTVEIAISEVVTEKGPEGRVVAIVSRGRTHIAGIVTEITRRGAFAYAPMLGFGQKLLVESESGEELKVGDRIVMKVVEWGTKDSPTISTFSHHLGHISDASRDNAAAIEEYELRNDFPTKVVNEAKTFGTRVLLSEINQREDLRSLTCFTIDPDTAKDYDDAVNVTKDKNGHYHLGVHIADVSHYVTPGSALDEEAGKRCNSTYFPGFCLPMLPRELSDNLCSLKPDVNRLTVSVLMEFDATGELCHYRITRSVIRSCKRFTYREAKAVLDGTKASPHTDTLHLMVELCGVLKRKRYERGSIEFGLPELVVLVDEKGMPSGTDYVVYDITHQLVEEFMLKANETVATHLSKEGKNLSYRVHDEPAEENMKDFSILASAFGFKLSPIPTPKEIQTLFDEAMHTPYGEYLATSYIRKMRLAVYSSDNIGHYGLSLSHYCHFTSPIRRYIDLVIHRILFHENEDKDVLERISTVCSDQERISAKAENSVTMLKKLRLLDLYRQKDRHRQYDAVVTKVKNFGIYFEVIELMFESYLHVSDLDNDYFIYDDATMSLRGRHHGITYKAGDKLTVMLKDIDLIKLESKWDLVPEDIRPAKRNIAPSVRKDVRDKEPREKETRHKESKEKKSKKNSSKKVDKNFDAKADKKIDGKTSKKKFTSSEFKAKKNASKKIKEPNSKITPDQFASSKFQEAKGGSGNLAPAKESLRDLATKPSKFKLTSRMDKFIKK